MVLKPSIQPVEIPFSVTESGANTFTTLNIALPVQLGSGLVFDLDVIEMEGLAVQDAAAVGIVSSEMNVTLSVQTAMLQWSNQDLIAASKIVGHASAIDLPRAVSRENLHMDTKDRANYIAAESVNVSVAGINQTTARRITGRLIGSLVKLSQVDLTQILLSQL